MKKRKLKLSFDKTTLAELEQFGFSQEMVSVGGDIPINILADHMDKQASLLAYWGAKVERAKYEQSVIEDDYQKWYARYFDLAFWVLKEKRVNTPTKTHVEAIMFRKWGKSFRDHQETIREAEYITHMLNVIYKAVETKGGMLQSLRHLVTRDIPVDNLETSNGKK